MYSSTISNRAELTNYKTNQIRTKLVIYKSQLIEGNQNICNDLKNLITYLISSLIDI